MLVVIPIDDAMKLGYNWIYGPFELLDQIGAQRVVERMQKENRQVAPMLLLAAKQHGFYQVIDQQLCSLEHGGQYAPTNRPAGVLRFSELPASDTGSSTRFFKSVPHSPARGRKQTRMPWKVCQCQHWWL